MNFVKFFWKLMSYQCGIVEAGGGGGGNGSPAAWSESIPADQMIDHGGKQISLRELPAVKETPDLTTFVRRFVEKDTELGRRVRIPTAAKEGEAIDPKEIESWRKEHYPKLVRSGLLDGPPEKPEEYGFKQPDGMHPLMKWSDDMAKSAMTALHQAGASKKVADVAFKIHHDFVTGMAAAFGEQSAALEAKQAESLKALQTKWADKYDVNMEVAKRGMARFFKDGEQLRFFNDIVILGADGKPRVSLVDTPEFLEAMQELGALHQEDDAHLRGGDGGGGGGNDPAAEMARAMNEATHPMNAHYKNGSNEWQAWVEKIFKAKYGTAPAQQ
jgi:hypothetical protein